MWGPLSRPGGVGKAGMWQAGRIPGWACADWPSGEQEREEAHFLAVRAFQPVVGPAFSADSTLTRFWVGSEQGRLVGLWEGSRAGKVCCVLLSSEDRRSWCQLHGRVPTPPPHIVFPECTALMGSLFWRAGLPGPGDARPHLPPRGQAVTCLCSQLGRSGLGLLRVSGHSALLPLSWCIL